MKTWQYLIRLCLISVFFLCSSTHSSERGQVKFYKSKDEAVSKYTDDWNRKYGGTHKVVPSEVFVFVDDVNGDGVADLTLTDGGRCGKSCSLDVYLCQGGSSACEKGYCYAGIDMNGDRPKKMKCKQ